MDIKRLVFTYEDSFNGQMFLVVTIKGSVSCEQLPRIGRVFNPTSK